MTSPEGRVRRGQKRGKGVTVLEGNVGRAKVWERGKKKKKKLKTLT